MGRLREGGGCCCGDGGGDGKVRIGGGKPRVDVSGG